MDEGVAPQETEERTEEEAFTQTVDPVRAHTCDRCGAAMIAHNCKIICTNCGHQLDCSDLNIYFD